jgi:hypothetical protein
LTYIASIFEPIHTTPCQLSPQGSPPFAVHPGRAGDPSATYNPFIAETAGGMEGRNKPLATFKILRNIC